MKTLALAFAVLAAASASAQAYKGFAKGYCTYYAAQEFDKVSSKPQQNWRGNAAQWATNASSAGWQIQTNVNPGTIPNGSLVVWNDGGFGHVAVVRGIDGNGITIEEMNWGPRLVDPANGITDRFNCVDRSYLTFAQVQKRGKTGKYAFVGYVLPKRR